MASIAGLYGNFTSQEDGGGGRTIFLRGLRIPVGDKKSDGKKSSQNPGPPTDAAHNQASRGGNDEWVDFELGPNWIQSYQMVLIF